MANCITCGDAYPERRLALGYRTCLSCGDKRAHEVRHTVMIPYSKGAYQVVSPSDLPFTNPKRIEGA